MKDVKVKNENELMDENGVIYIFQELKSKQLDDRCLKCDIYKDEDMPCGKCESFDRVDGKDGVYKLEKELKK